MRLVHQTWMSVIMALAMMGGCASRGGLEVLESELRQQEDRLTGLQQQLAATQSELQISQNEVAQLRAQLATSGQQAHSPEHFENEYKAVGLRFNTYLTSGVDRDGRPGDEMLSVLLYPHDEQGGLVKLPGTIELRAVDLTAPEGSQEVGSWTFTPAQTKDAWHSGFLAAGFLFEESWSRLPQGSNLTLHARFKTIDGRQFDAVQPLKVSAPPAESLSQETQLQQRQTSVRTGKPTIQQVGLEVPEPVDIEEIEDIEVDDGMKAEFIADEEPDSEAKDRPAEIETSDRYREWDRPVIR